VKSNVFMRLVNIPSHQWSLKLEGRRKIIGSSVGADGMLPDYFRHVGDYHAEAWIDRDGIWIRDFGTEAGTRVNSLSLPRFGATRLELGDQVKIGDADLEAVVGEGRPVSQGTRQAVDVDAVTLLPDDLLCAVAASQVCATRALMLSRLTDAELDMVMFVRRGLTSEHQLLDYFDMDISKVRTLLESILTKLEVRSVDELAALLFRIARNDQA
jgi:DNA-binding CsgD family transcriptional regulator